LFALNSGLPALYNRLYRRCFRREQPARAAHPWLSRRWRCGGWGPKGHPGREPKRLHGVNARVGADAPGHPKAPAHSPATRLQLQMSP